MSGQEYCKTLSKWILTIRLIVYIINSTQSGEVRVQEHIFQRVYRDFLWEQNWSHSNAVREHEDEPQHQENHHLLELKGNDLSCEGGMVLITL